MKNKDALVMQIAYDHRITKKEAQLYVDTTMQGIVNALKSGENLMLVGLGTFVVSNRAPRETTNPATGGVIQVPERNYVSFRAGERLREAVNLKKALTQGRKRRLTKTKGGRPDSLPPAAKKEVAQEQKMQPQKKKSLSFKPKKKLPFSF